MLRLSFVVSAFIFISSISVAQQADEIIGNYHLPNNLDIEIYKDGSKYFGKIIALNGFEDGQKKDLNNPDKLKQSEILTGKIIIKNLEYNTEKKQWLNGSMYGPEKGMVFNLKITEMRENEIQIVGSKYFIWKTLNWKKI